MGRQRRSGGRHDAMRTADTIQSGSQRKSCKDKQKGGRGALATTEQCPVCGDNCGNASPENRSRRTIALGSNGSFPQTSSQHWPYRSTNPKTRNPVIEWVPKSSCKEKILNCYREQFRHTQRDRSLQLAFCLETIPDRRQFQQYITVMKGEKSENK